MNHFKRGGEAPFCEFHPYQVIIGICPLCLKERLLILSSKQRHLSTILSCKEYSSSSILHPTTTSTKPHHPNVQFHLHKKSSTLNVKIFALKSFFHRQADNKSSNDEDGIDYTSSNEEDSFISIKFQDNGVASWDKGTKDSEEETLEKMSTHNNNKETNFKGPIPAKIETSVVEHVKPHAVIKWRKRIGQLFQIMRWKKSTNKTNHVVNKVSGGVKMKKGNWIRTLTKRR